MIRICICGHLDNEHGPWQDQGYNIYPKACLALTDKVVDDIFECKGCFQFQLDNLKSLELTYNDKSKSIL